MAAMWVAVGQRVRVRPVAGAGPGPWPSEPTGCISIYPDGSEHRKIATVTGEQRMWMVIFDEPQHDADGDGPYDQCPVLESQLTPIEQRSSCADPTRPFIGRCVDTIAAGAVVARGLRKVAAGEGPLN
jgi:hypothetical protein